MRSAILLITMVGCGGGGKVPDAVRPAPPPLPAYASAEPIASVRMFAPAVVSTEAVRDLRPI